jgi:16S rRNA (uracil1498-N3)-methyltransferase
MGVPQHVGFRARFFITDEVAVGAEAVLSPQDAHHVARVLRLRLGEQCEVVSPAGRVLVGEVVSSGEVVRIVVRREATPAEIGATYRNEVGIVQALARPAAVDLTVEKGTEVGASFFALVQAHGSPRAGGGDPAARLTRWNRVAMEAAKQSKQTAVPRIGYFPSVGEALRHVQQLGRHSVVLEPSAKRPLTQVVDELARGPGERLGFALWIGPEGGWSAEELRTFADSRLPLARLGQSVLRTETAGPVAVTLTRLTLEDW